MSFASSEDRNAIEKEMPWGERDVATTLFAQITKTATSFPNRPAVSFQLLSDPTDTAETLNWSELLTKTTQAANLFRKLGVGENDVVAYVLPNATEKVPTELQKFNPCPEWICSARYPSVCI